ncbi:MAG TPA: mercuric reductase, partial [Porticoccaceae bacterium]|nr:mercuric reductase [Porticoccaceae bacterium]
MTCPSCVGHVKEALDAIEGVINVEVSYKNANAAITANAGVSVADLVGAIEALGYTAKENTSPSAYGENTTTSDTGGNRSQQVVIIGSGSAAFACAIKAAERGAKVTLIEGADVIG